MTEERSNDESLRALLDAACNDTITDAEFERLEAALASSEDARRLYLRYFTLTGELRYLVSMAHADEAACERTGREYAAGNLSSRVPCGPSRQTAPRLSFPVGVLQGMAGCLTQDWTRAYLLAGVVLGLFLLLASFVHVSQPVAVDQPQLAEAAPATEFVGRITGMTECRWSDPRTETYAGASIPLNRRYALASGLMEITYETGAKVILEGPCTYQVESRASGYLALGKLTARVETDKETRRQGDKENRKPISESSSFILHPSSFVVKTPTAIVTDQGTEFGVEVGQEGNSTSHVFRGTIKVQVIGDDRKQDVVLRENESARVERGRDGGDLRLVVGEKVGVPPKFVRRLYEPPKVLDLLDIVAGGDGRGNRRERGIDPVTGMEDPTFVTHYRGGDRQYWRVGWHRLIDGVFVPDGRDGQVQLDSAGHAFDGFPETSGEVYGSIWARAAEIGSKRVKSAQPWVYAILREEQFMPKGRGLLGIYANSGITFDLEAVRKTYPQARPARFRATAGLADGPRKDPEAFGMADVWVFVDGRLKLKREKLRVRDGTFPVDVELGPRDRFLTLVATDGGNGISWDSVVFGDPVLETNAIRDDVPQFEDRKEDNRK